MKNNLFSLCVIFLLLIANYYAEEISKSLVKECSQNMWKCVLKTGEISNFYDKQSLPKSRVKRNVLRNGKCAVGEVWYIYRCWPCEEYREITGKHC